MKKTLILSAFSAVVLATGLFAFNSASAQDYYGGFDSGYGSGFDSGYGGGFDSGYSSYGGGFDSGYGSGSGFDSGYSSYNGGFDSGYGSYSGGFDSGYGGSNLNLYDGSYYGYNADGCGLNCGSSYGSSYSSYDSGCGSSCYGGGSSYFSVGCGSFCGGGFSGWGGFSGYSGGGIGFLPPIYVPPRVNPPVTLPPVYVPPTYQPPTYLPPVYNPPTYNPPVYNPPTYNPPVYYPPPVVVPPLVCSIRFSNFNPSLAAAEGQLWTYGLQAISTGSYSNQISYRLVSGPDGLIVTPNGQMAWTPAFNQGRSTSYMVTVAAYNGSCENSQTFYITVQDMNPVPPPQPPVVYKPKPQPFACVACCVATVVTPTCLPKPVTPQYGACPPDATTVAAAPTVAMPDTGAGAPTGSSFVSAAGGAVSGLFGALLSLLYSPWLLLAVILILAIMVVRAYQRTRSMTIAI